jgi:hypothetical protein
MTKLRSPDRSRKGVTLDRRLRISYAATATATLCSACLAAAAISGSFFASAASTLRPGVKQVETVDDYIVVHSSTSIVSTHPRSDLIIAAATTAATEPPTTVAETEPSTAPPTTPTAPKPKPATTAAPAPVAATQPEVEHEPETTQVKRQWPRPTTPPTTEPEHQGTWPGTTSPFNGGDDHEPGDN